MGAPQDTYKWLSAHREDFIAQKRLTYVANNPFERVYYFISSEMGDNPPIYRLDCRATLERAKEIDLSFLALSLLELFRRAIVAPQTPPDEVALF